jgi:ribosome-interacting GTPase 1
MVIRPEGAAQIALLGPPNSGKTSLHTRLTGSHAQCGPYPFTTQFPQPGMLPYKDIHFQLIDLPPLSREHPVPWIGNTLQPAHACLLVVDLGDPACIDQVLALHEILAEKRVTLTDRWEPGVSETEVDEVLWDDPFAVRLPTLLVVTKADQLQAPQEELQVFQELTGLNYPAMEVSATTGRGLEQIGPWLFRELGIVRVYTKAPGRPPDLGRPFTVRHGQTVRTLAMLVHRDIAGALKHARLWSGDQSKGQQVGRDHPLSDGDIVELHT